MTEQHHTPEHTHTINHTVTAGTEAHVTLVQKPATPALIPDLTEGRIVHYVLPHGRSAGSHRPAIVVRDWKQANGLVQLQVFTDNTNDFEHGKDGYFGILWAASVRYSDAKEPGTWHFIEQA